jgi:hypothetical protein
VTRNTNKFSIVNNPPFSEYGLYVLSSKNGYGNGGGEGHRDNFIVNRSEKHNFSQVAVV